MNRSDRAFGPLVNLVSYTFVLDGRTGGDFVFGSRD